MTFTLTPWRLTLDSYRDEEGEWTPCTPLESGAMTALCAALYLAPLVAFLYFLLF